jgi:hypothetical protein
MGTGYDIVTLQITIYCHIVILRPHVKIRFFSDLVAVIKSVFDN